MSLFGDLDIASAVSDPFNITDEGIYKGAISDVSLVEGENKDGVPYKAVVIKLTAEDGRSYQDWLRFPMPQDSDAVVSMKKTFIKAFYQGLEIPEDRMNSVTPEDIKGMDVVFTLKKNKKGYMNCTVQVPRGTPVGHSAPGSAFASVKKADSNDFGL